MFHLFVQVNLVIAKEVAVNSRRFWFWIILLNVLATNVLEASDGVIEINQSCALSAGCISGDGAGFPITINQPGSYVLTSNLLAQSSDLSTISIEASNVTLDLNGFAIIGGTSCSETGAYPNVITCTGSGPSYGILVNNGAVTLRSVVIRNGNIKGIGGTGILLGASTDGAVIEDIEVTHSGSSGIRATGVGIVVRRAVVSLCYAFGISVHVGAQVESAVTWSNGFNGIQAGDRSILENVTSRSNTGAGILAGYDVKVLAATVYGNGGDGIQINAGGTVSRASSAGNVGHGIVLAGSGIVESSTANDNDGDGIHCGNECLISGNTARLNAGSGVDVEGGSVLDNVLSGNLHGIRSNSFELLYGRNNLTGSLGNAVSGLVIAGFGSLGDNFCESFTPQVATKC